MPAVIVWAENVGRGLKLHYAAAAAPRRPISSLFFVINFHDFSSTLLGFCGIISELQLAPNIAAKDVNICKAISSRKLGIRSRMTAWRAHP